MNDHQIIGQAIVFIENHLYETITARDAAEAVSYSYYHFHRYFSAVMGEYQMTREIGSSGMHTR